MILTITPQRLAELHSAGTPIELIDVRTPAEYRELHITIARNVPLDRLDPESLRSGRNDESEPLYVICRSGNRAQKACEKLFAAGVPNIVNVEGGTLAWNAAGLPVVRGKATISLERQVRIAAGLLVVVGALLAYSVDPRWIALSGLVGAGVAFAGITDTCAMGMLLARMPWNQAGGGCASSKNGVCGDAVTAQTANTST